MRFTELSLAGAFLVDIEPIRDDRGLFDGAVVISDATGSIFEKGFGFANAERHVVFTPDTPADGASLAKTFTAALLLSMQHDGMLDLDKPLTCRISSDQSLLENGADRTG